MIIECQTCHARFRLDESRITGRGARVKCRKCGESIVVLKDSSPPPTPPGGDGFFDLGGAVRDTDAERPDSPPPAGNLIRFPAPSRPEEPAPPVFFPPEREAAEPEKDEVDLAFERFLSTGPEDPPPPVGRTERDAPGFLTEGIPQGQDSHAGSGSRPDLDFGALSLDLGPEEKLDLPPVAALDPTFGEKDITKRPAEFHGGGFLISDSDTLDFLQETRVDPEPDALLGGSDISLEISSTPSGGTDAFPASFDAPPTNFGVSLTNDYALDSSAPEGEKHSIEGNATPPPASVIPAPPDPGEKSAREPSKGAPARHESRHQDAPSARPFPWLAVAALSAILAAGAGGYFGFTPSGRKMLEGVVPRAAKIWGGNPETAPSSRYDLRSVIGYYESGAASPRILVIKGQVANLSTEEKSNIRVQAALLDNTDAVLMQEAVYAGNLLSGEMIRKGDRGTLSKALGNRFGEGLANMHVPPGKTIPFMVLFFDAPETMDSYKLEAKDGE
jgi:predicted Zn finger-like uncharacterized protein